MASGWLHLHTFRMQDLIVLAPLREAFDAGRDLDRWLPDTFTHSQPSRLFIASKMAL